METAPSAGTRHRRFFTKVEVAKVAIKTLDKISETGEWRSGLESIVAFYLLGELEGTKVVESMRQGNATSSKA